MIVALLELKKLMIGSMNLAKLVKGHVCVLVDCSGMTLITRVHHIVVHDIVVVSSKCLESLLILLLVEVILLVLSKEVVESGSNFISGLSQKALLGWESVQVY